MALTSFVHLPLPSPNLIHALVIPPVLASISSVFIGSLSYKAAAATHKYETFNLHEIRHHDRLLLQQLLLWILVGIIMIPLLVLQITISDDDSLFNTLKTPASVKPTTEIIKMKICRLAVLLHMPFVLSIFSGKAVDSWASKQRKYGQAKSQYVHLMAISSLVPLIRSAFSLLITMDAKDDETVMQDDILIFLFCFAVLSIWSYFLSRNRKRRVNGYLMQGRPTENTRGTQYGRQRRFCGWICWRSTPVFQISSPQHLDERRWYEWKPAQVLDWIKNNDTNHSYHQSHYDTKKEEDEENENALLVQVLSSHVIYGSTLPAITVSDLCFGMGVPYGMAHKFVHRIRTQLLEMYPMSNDPHDAEIGLAMFGQPQQFHHNRQLSQSLHSPTAVKVDQFGAAKKSMQGNKETEYKIGRQSIPNVALDAALTCSDTMESTGANQQDDVMVNYSQKLMKERFGLGLPSLQTSDVQELQNNQQIYDGSSPKLEVPPLKYSKPELQIDENDSKSLSPEEIKLDKILQSMPDHIRNIAIQNPELAKSLMTSPAGQRKSILQSSVLSNQQSDEMDFPIDTHHCQESNTSNDDIHFDYSDEDFFNKSDDESGTERAFLLRRRNGTNTRSLK